jgi:membrane-bound lytic murein transglycosylase MltF
VVLVALVIAPLSCDRRPTNLPAQIGEKDDESEPSSTAGTEYSDESGAPASSPGAANLVPMMDLEAAEVLKLNKPWRGDLSQIGEQRFIRALVAYNRITYFVDRAQQRGVAYASLVEFERVLRARSGKGNLAPKIVIIPTSRDRLLRGLAAGYGDIAIGALIITPERRKMVDFSDPILENVSEVVVTGPSAPTITSLDDLSGREVHVRPTSSYHESLVALNERFRREGKKPVVIRPADELLEDEDLIQMTDAGLIGITIVQDYIAKFWGQLYEGVKVHDDLAVSRGGKLAWAIRKNAPELKRAINVFVRTHRAGTPFGSAMAKRYLDTVDRLKNPIDEKEIGKFRQLEGYFRKYSDQYGLPWLLMAAQGYQESRLDQSQRSPVGAVGVMQLMPATAYDLGMPDVSSAENNIHAGIKYMRLMLDRHFKNAPMDRLNKGLFALASYNAGPGRVAGLRRRAGQLGLDQNKWFDNVEIVASHEIGRETVDYVSNIYKYYTAYRAVTYIRKRKSVFDAEKAEVAH